MAESMPGTVASALAGTMAGALAAGEKRKVKMKSSSYGSHVIAAFREFRKEDELCDFTVMAEGKSIRVHRLLLAATSKYFRIMFQNKMKENLEGGVDLQALSAQSLEFIINFLYTGDMELELDTLTDVLDAASHLMVDSAIELCTDFMISLLTFANADEILSIAERYALLPVSQNYRTKVLENFEEFSMTCSFKNLSAAALKDYLSDDRLIIRSELALFEIVGHWFKVSKASPDDVLQVLSGIRFALMSKSHLEQLQHHWLTTLHSDKISLAIAVGIKYHHESELGHPWLSESCRVRTASPCLAFVHQGCNYRQFEITAYNNKNDKFYQLCTERVGNRDCRVVSFSNFLFICRVVDCGGGALMNSMMRFDPRHLKLFELTPCRHLRLEPALVATNRCLYIMGGHDEAFHPLTAVECYDVQNNAWLDAIALPLPLHSHAAAYLDNCVYVSGGIATTDRQATTTFLRFDMKQQNWTELPNMRYSRRLHETTCIGAKVYVLGGISDHSVHQQTQILIECFDTLQSQWSILCPTLAGRSVGHFIAHNDMLISIGREHYRSTEDEIWYYDFQEDCWKVLTQICRRSGLSTATCSLLNVDFSNDLISGRILTETR